MLDSQLPLVLRARLLEAFVDAEGALEPQSKPHWNKVVIGFTKNHRKPSTRKASPAWVSVGLGLGLGLGSPCQINVDALGSLCKLLAAELLPGMVGCGWYIVTLVIALLGGEHSG